jgi:hypothetical protein
MTASDQRTGRAHIRLRMPLSIEYAPWCVVTVRTPVIARTMKADHADILDLRILVIGMLGCVGCGPP